MDARPGSVAPSAGRRGIFFEGLWARVRDYVPGRRELFSRQSIALGLTILIHILLLLLLLIFERPVPVPRKDERMPTMFTMMPEPEKKNPGAKSKEKVKRADQVAKVDAKAPVPTPKPPAEQKSTSKPSMLNMNSMDFAASDISKLPSSGAKLNNGGGGGAPVAGPGEGPGGMTLYRAEWYREPTWTEIAPYLPANLPRYAWADLACRAIENFHVDNCQLLRESQPGSGYGRGMRRAAWQFLIRPQRLNGRLLIGEPILVHCEFGQVERPSDDSPDGTPPDPADGPGQ